MDSERWILTDVYNLAVPLSPSCKITLDKALKTHHIELDVSVEFSVRNIYCLAVKKSIETVLFQGQAEPGSVKKSIDGYFIS